VGPVTRTRARSLRLRAALLVAAALLAGPLAGCTSERPVDAASRPAEESRLPGSTMRGQEKQAPPTLPSTTSPAASPTSAGPAGFHRTAAMRTVRRLARGGAREATSAEFRGAADDVQTRLGQLGYRVRRQAFTVPAGVSWGVAVGSGTTYNIVATPPGFDPLRPHVVVGAHLDTVPQAPGAEDNASGVAVLLETARLAVDGGTRLPVVWVAFGAEEPRGPGDEQHHFGSQAYVRRLGEDRRAALRGMVSLDRVGVPGRVPVCTGGRSPLRLRRGLLSAARAAGVPARACVNRTSDHWPFEKAGLTVARLGGIDYAGYHSSRDVASVVSPRQLDRVGRVLWQWLRER
jgi:hypothetical protein